MKLDLKVKAQCFSKDDLRMLALMFCCMHLSTSAGFVRWKRVTNEKFASGTSSGLFGFFCSFYRLEHHSEMIVWKVLMFTWLSRGGVTQV